MDTTMLNPSQCQVRLNIRAELRQEALDTLWAEFRSRQHAADEFAAECVLELIEERRAQFRTLDATFFVPEILERQGLALARLTGVPPTDLAPPAVTPTR